MLPLQLHALTPETISRLLSEAGAERYRAQQVLAWIYQRGVRDPLAMSDLPQPLRQSLSGATAAPALTVVADSQSSDGTRKLAVRLGDGELIESVLIPDRHRLTLCVSSQVGCAMGCGFCATARLGLKRNLAVEEIVGQVMLARDELARRPIGTGQLTNIVFMGMGEPLHNLDNLIPALEILSAPWGAAISPRRITVSTVGLIPEMKRLLELTQVKLAVSLGATTEARRRSLMPVTRKYSLERLMAACRELPVPRRRRITFEYVLLEGENDSPEDARRLVKLLHGIRAKVNLICFNPFPAAGFRATPRPRVENFQRALLDHGVSATVRESRGADIAAACGQLAARAGGAPADQPSAQISSVVS